MAFEIKGKGRIRFSFGLLLRSSCRPENFHSLQEDQRETAKLGMDSEFLEGLVRVKIGVFLSGPIPLIGRVIVDISAGSFDEITSRKKAGVHDRGICQIADISGKQRRVKKNTEPSHRLKVYRTVINSGMPQKIARLPEEVVNQIAAGEVVENPASMIKELIENSLDAGAHRIAVWIEGASIRVEDDGCGMDRADALLCLERHATSKIRTERDLHNLATMGFRGEALAAIAAVSHLEVKTADGHEGTRIQAEGGKVAVVEPCARNRGTTVEIRSLFFNVPARLKFMKSKSAGLSQMVRVVETIALAHPERAFSLYSENKALVEVFPNERRKRIESLVGPMPHEINHGSVWGVLSPAEEAKQQRRGQYLFINQRPVFSSLVSRAIKAGYGTRIAERAYPSFVLFLSIPPGEIDVNVHPQKKEVRFADEGKIFRLFERAAASVFEAGPSFLEPLVFTQPSFSLAEEASPQRFHSTPLAFDFPLTEKPLAVAEGFLFLQSESLLLIDLAAAHARVLFESLSEKKGAVQALMWPIEVIADEEEMAEELQAMGIECRWIGKRTLAVDALPALLSAAEFPDFLRDWREGKRIDLAASRYARGAKKSFHLDEAYLLWQQLQQCREKRYDPVGKLIWGRADASRLRECIK